MSCQCSRPVEQESLTVCGHAIYRLELTSKNCDFLSMKNSEHVVLFRKSFDTHCCHMGTAIKHPVPDRVKSSFVIFDIRAL